MDLKRVVIIKEIYAGEGITKQKDYFIHCDKPMSEKLLNQIYEDTNIWLPDIQPRDFLPNDLKHIIVSHIDNIKSETKCPKCGDEHAELGKIDGAYLNCSACGHTTEEF